MLRTKGRRKFFTTSSKNLYRVNERIRVPEVLVIDETGQKVGVMKTSEALALALEKEMDLVEVFPKAAPPVVKIIDFGQFQYQQNRKLQEQKAKTKKIEIKGLRISYKMGRHDLEFRKDQAIKFLKKGDKVRVEMILRGRERQFTKEAVVKINEFIKTISPEAELIIEQPLKKQGGQLTTLLAAKS
ncbi:MAG: translation initiation factor IF-3 [Candidatus Komeilibacteria bacterium RIFCSPLOWO2_01_FULL_45_10]|uniref:Translation initiation factor IF-3 n=1 Tax=Candidatus Komeilibacteria bacterium RIFCSPLOWO2_01_FULL_45_10 TaxID=1798550 RepID=A0A1G2BIT0_9BACT|nr:MAG: translation initiation factor IF-3 [Candidatus Komeilibacteria bacterium RIFCSPLOWO2_01_FULL_45_10]